MFCLGVRTFQQKNAEKVGETPHSQGENKTGQAVVMPRESV
jgi:hypothetical protein